MLDLLLSLFSMMIFAPLAFQFSIGCCCGSCNICTDDFHRDDNLDIDEDSPCGWTIESGAAEIFSNECGIGTSDTIAIADPTSTDNGSDSYAVRVTAWFRASTDGDEVRVYFKWIDSNSHWYAQLTIGSGGTLKIFEVSGGTPTERDSVNLTVDVNPDDHTSIYVCWGAAGPVVQIGVDIAEYVIDGTDDTPTQAGIGVGTISSAVFFTLFSYDWGYEPEQHTSCTHCTYTCGNCDDDQAPEQMKLVISGVSNASCSDCTGLNGIWYLDYKGNVVIPLFSSVCFWSVEAPSICGESPSYLLFGLTSGTAGECSYSNSDIGSSGAILPAISGTFQWRRDVGSTHGVLGSGCTEYVDEPLDVYPGSGDSSCSWTSATIELSSVTT